MNLNASNATHPPGPEDSISSAGLPAPIPLAGSDSHILGLGMALTAIAVGVAIYINYGDYNPFALLLLTFGLVCSFAAIALAKPLISHPDPYDLRRLIIAIILVGVLLDVILIINGVTDDLAIGPAVMIISSMTVIAVLGSHWIKRIALTAMLLAYLLMGIHEIHQTKTAIDVFEFQQESARGLMKGKNPYAMRFRSPYGRHSPFYFPGAVDENDMLKYGFPYPPLSLLMSTPSVLLGGDCRYGDLLALVISAGLMAFARPGRFGVLAAGLLLLMPRNLYVLEQSWTEPLLLLNFSLLMFCAFRWRSAMPYVLGLFLATKQYSVLALPFLIFLVQGPHPWRQLARILLKATLVGLVITAPFYLWNRHEFWRDVVQWQFLQPFRMDSLSYLAWFRFNDIMGWLFNASTGQPWMIFPFILCALTAVFCLWRSPRSPAGFAAAVAVIYLVFYAFNKQAFCNYYFFAIGAACWSIASLRDAPIPPLLLRRQDIP